MNERQPTIYILASRHNRTLYTGVTASRTKRVWEQERDIIGGFTKKYGVYLPACVDCSDKPLCDCHSRESGNPVRIPGTRDNRLSRDGRMRKNAVMIPRNIPFRERP